MKVCKKCGGEEFYASGKCAECVRQRVKTWIASNPDRAKASRRAYYLANRERFVEMSRSKRAANIEESRKRDRNRKRDPKKLKMYKEKYRNENLEKLRAYEKKRREQQPEKVEASKKKWRDEHPEQCRVHVQNRHARKKHNGGTLSRGIVRKLMDLQKGKCACCRIRITENYHIDHIMPLAKGGKHADNNAQLLCPPCNQSKNSKDPVDFMQSRGFLI